MKNGPVFSNITMINKCFSDLGTPLPYSMILDYLRMNWANGRGISEKEASKLLNIALNANYYYTEITPQHYQRKSQIMDELDTLHIPAYPDGCSANIWTAFRYYPDSNSRFTGTTCQLL